MSFAATVETPSLASRPRAIGILAIATGLAGVALLAAHPGGEAKTFADVLANEAANRGMDALVHGGFIGVLAAQTVCYAVLSARIGFHRVAAIAGLVLFGFGTAFLCGSMLLDGLVTPAVAARYVGKPEKIEAARTIFVLVGTMISFLMPIGQLFQSAAIAAWGWGLTASGSRILGLFGLGLGTLLVAGLASSLVAMNPIVLMAGIAGTALWAIAAGIWLLSRA